jgi:hypothetical protein
MERIGHGLFVSYRYLDAFFPQARRASRGARSQRQRAIVKGASSTI